MTTETNPPPARYCTNCGYPLDPAEVRYCGHCGLAVVRPIEQRVGVPAITSSGNEGTSVSQTPADTAPVSSRSFLRIAGTCVILIILVLALKTSMTENKKSSPEPAFTSNVKAELNASVDPHQKILADTRRSYIDGLREEIRNVGGDASVSDLDGELIVVSDAFKLKPDRDRFIRQSFGTKTRQELCAMGFKSFAVKSGVLFGDGDEYSFGCKETKEERETRLQKARADKDKFVHDLQEAIQNDPQSPGAQVIERSNELVLTMPSLQGLDPGTIRQMLGGRFSNQVKRNLCSVGLRGFRVITNVNSAGVALSFGCAGNNAKGLPHNDPGTAKDGEAGTTPAPDAPVLPSPLPPVNLPPPN